MKSRAKKQYSQPTYLLTGRVPRVKLWLRRFIQQYNFKAAFFITCLILSSCEKNFDVKLTNYKPLLVVEGYINNQLRDYNYIVLSRSLEYFSTDFQSVGVSNANEETQTIQGKEVYLFPIVPSVTWNFKF